MRRNFFIIIFGLFLCFPLIGNAQPAPAFDLDSIRENRKNPVTVPLLENDAIKVDGMLDEDAWKTAAKFEDFVQTEPGYLIAPSKRTVAYMAYDRKHLYIAFKSFDNPDEMTYSVALRDQVGQEDYVGLLLDTFDDQRRAYEFRFNPLGVQADGIRNAGEFRTDFSVDVVMESEGKVLPDGYSVEVKIPFKSLRYSAGEGKFWGVDFFRRIDRFNRETSGWIPGERGVSDIQQLGKITGLNEIKTERTLEIIPTVTLGKSATRIADPAEPEGSRLAGDPFQKELGLSVKYQITPNVTLDLALNPDFAEVEADAPVLQANERFPIFFPERRPFFLEGIEIFRSRLQVVNTRTIADPDVALKVTGKVGKTVIGALAAVDNFEDEDQKAYAGILRLRRDVGANSNIGVFATTYHRGSQQHNNLFGFDGAFQIDPRTVFSFEVFGTHSRRFFFEPEINDSIYRTGNAVAYRAEWDYTGLTRGSSLEITGRTDDYRADLGFNRRTSIHGVRYGYRLQTEPDADAKLIRFTHRGFARGNVDSRGRILNSTYRTFNSFDLQDQLEINLRGTFRLERLYEDEFGASRNQNQDGAFFGEPFRETFVYGASAQVEKSFGNRVRLSADFGFDQNRFDFDFGASERFTRVSPVYLQFLIDRQTNPNLEEPPIDLGKGFSWGWDLGAEFQPTDPLNIRFSYERNILTRHDTNLTAFDAHIYSLRTTYQFTRFLSSRTRMDYETVNGSIGTQLLFGWTPNPGTSLFVGYNDFSNYRAFNDFRDRFDTGFRRDNMRFFFRASYLFRKSF